MMVMIMLGVPFLLFSLSLLSPMQSLPRLPTHNVLANNGPLISNGSLSNSIINGFQSANSHILKPRQPLNLGSFNAFSLTS